MQAEPTVPTEDFSLTDPVSWLNTAWDVIKSVWNYELFTIEGQPLEVGRVFVASVLLILGIGLSRRLSRLVASRVLGRFNLSEPGQAALQTVTFYLSLVIFTFIALKLASVPLGIFALLGGALAIGIGFGSQNVVSNFISGLLLMVEQPVKVGDLIEVGTALGSVEKIGARSTVVRKPDNTHVVLPNSHLLENAVINWTLSDKLVRTSILVGIAYGSDTTRARDLLMEVAGEDPRVRKQPEANVLFTDFGDNALAFELQVWLKMNSLSDRRRLESDLRYAIDARFRAGDIVIAFPQRDVHLDSTKPVEVRMVPG